MIPITPAEEKLWRLENDLKEWKAIALYFGEILAASGHEIANKSKASKWEIQRHYDICKDAAKMVQHGHFMGPFRHSQELVAQRLEEARQALKEREK